MLLVRSALRSARVPGWQQVVAQAVPSQLKSKAAVVIDYVASARAATATTSSLLLSQYASALVRQLPRGTTAVSSFNSATLASSRIARNDGDDDGRRIPSAAETQTRRIPGIERGTPGTKTRTPDAASPSSSIDTRQRTPAAPVIRSADIATANSKYHKTRLPIVMCHGLFGFDKIGPEAIPALQMHYWTGLADSLRSTGCEVYIARVPAVGTIEERARHLDRFLAKRLHGRDINLLAHSMGGLDARFLIAHLPNRAYTVRSLTTVATPHRGSPVMDWVRDTIGIGARPRDVLLASEVATAEGSATASKDKVAASLLTRLLSPFDAPAYSNLTTDYMTQRFNPATPDDPNVKYYSYGGAANVATLSPIRLTWEIVREKEGANDGIVSVYSARWGEYVQTVAADHFDLNRQRRILLDFRKLVALYQRLNVPAVPAMSSLNLGQLTTAFYGLQGILGAAASSGSGGGQVQATTVEARPASSVVISRPGKPATVTTTPVVSTPPPAAYEQRLKELVNTTYGPTAYDDYIYGVDYEKFRKEIKRTMAAAGGKEFDSTDFYLGAMNRLYRQGF